MVRNGHTSHSALIALLPLNGLPQCTYRHRRLQCLLMRIVLHFVYGPGLADKRVPWSQLASATPP